MEQSIERILQEMAEMQVTMDDIRKRLVAVEAKVEVMLINRQSVLQPLSTIEELEVFEKQADDEAIITHFKYKVGQYKPITPTKGRDICLEMVDHFFTRELLTHFTWSGRGKQGSTKRKAFRKYRKTINLFFCCVWQYDNSFTIQDTEDFFQKTLWRASKRNANE